MGHDEGDLPIRRRWWLHFVGKVCRGSCPELAREVSGEGRWLADNMSALPVTFFLHLGGWLTPDGTK